MSNKLFIIGNGFDLAHNLPTRFDPDFKNIAQQMETSNFWDIYNSEGDEIWSDFENLLGCPNFNSLEEIFYGYEPDYLSDRESDRDGIILQVELNGYLSEALQEFAYIAECSLEKTKRKPFFNQILDMNGYYISFNYTHTLEKIYDIPMERVLHIHGDVGGDDLVLGYPKGNFAPEEYSYDARQKGRGPYTKIRIEDYIQNIEDHYVRTAYDELYNKCKSFYKESRTNVLNSFLNEFGCDAGEIIVYGHSCAIDFDYFNYLSIRYPHACWMFYVWGDEQRYSVECLVNNFHIHNVKIEMI